MAERRGTRWREALSIGAGEFLALVILWTLGGIGFVVATWLVAAATSSPAIFAPVIAVLVVLIGWGAVLTIQHRPGLYLEHLTASRRSALGSGWVRWMRLSAMASVQVAALALIGYVAFLLTFG